MSIVHHRMRWVLTAVFALALALVTAAPRHAAALGNDLEFTGGYITASAYTGDPVLFAIDVNNPSVSPQITTASIDFPAGVSFVDGALMSGGCEISADSSTPTVVDVTFNIDAGDLCAVAVTVTFSVPGEYGASDTSWYIASATTSAIAEQLVNPNVTILERAPAFCEQMPDMAVSPQYIEIAPGGRATVSITMRNLCKDAPTVPGDLLISFSDGLTVVNATNGMTGAGQRAMLSTFQLEPDETRSWSVTVEAAADLATAPVHISEYYVGGRVGHRIDGVFITPAPAPAPVVESAPAPVAPAPAVPAVPATLPNTAGEATGMLPQLLTALAAAGAGLALRRRR